MPEWGNLQTNTASQTPELGVPPKGELRETLSLEMATDGQLALDKHCQRERVTFDTTWALSPSVGAPSYNPEADEEWFPGDDGRICKGGWVGPEAPRQQTLSATLP